MLGVSWKVSVVWGVVGCGGRTKERGRLALDSDKPLMSACLRTSGRNSARGLQCGPETVQTTEIALLSLALSTQAPVSYTPWTFVEWRRRCTHTLLTGIRNSHRVGTQEILVHSA